MYARPTLEPPTAASASSSWPTAAATDHKGKSADPTKRNRTSDVAETRNWPTATSSTTTGPGSQGRQGDNLQTAASTWPTPNASEAEHMPHARREGDRTLTSTAKQWMTPTSSLTNDAESPETFHARRERLAEKHGNGNGNGAGTPLTMQAKEWGTPTAHERSHSPRPVHHGVQLANQVSNWPTITVGDSESGQTRPSVNAKRGGGDSRLRVRAAMFQYGPPDPTTPKPGDASSPSDPTSRRLSVLLTLASHSRPSCGGLSALWLPDGTARPGVGLPHESLPRLLELCQTRRLSPRFVEWLMGFPLGHTEV